MEPNLSTSSTIVTNQAKVPNTNTAGKGGKIGLWIGVILVAVSLIIVFSSPGAGENGMLLGFPIIHAFFVGVCGIVGAIIGRLWKYRLLSTVLCVLVAVPIFYLLADLLG